MRISDWSSDVCSSDLAASGRRRMNAADSLTAAGVRSSDTLAPPKERRTVLNQEDFMTLLSTQLKFQDPSKPMAANEIDRKSVVSGKSVTVRVSLGGRRIIIKTKKQTPEDRVTI